MTDDPTTKLATLTQQIITCKKCPLHKKRTNAVPGEGAVNAELLFIGEGPGSEEDRLGRPFVGAAGKLLTEMLESIELPRTQVFIANIVKCRPPNNRDPEPAEIDACRDYLNEQIKLIQPKLIILLGRHSLNCFLPGQRISEAHGKVFRRKNGQHFLPLYHPAAALYSPSQRPAHLTDFRKIPQILSQIKKKSSSQQVAQAKLF